MGRRSEEGQTSSGVIAAVRRFWRRAVAWSTVRLLLTAAAMFAMAVSSSPAQDTGGLGGLSGILQQIQQNTGTVPSQANQPQSVTLQAPTQLRIPPPPSRLEKIFSARAGLPMIQFGYTLFEGLNQVTVPQVGTIQKYYVLGPGDALRINLRGQENSTYDVTIDNDGNVILPKLPPIHAAGHTFAEFQAALEAAVKKAYISTTVYVSVTQLRRVAVTVAGEVNAPGVKMLTGLSSPLDALILALGVKKSGSLRNIKIIRGGKILHYDLYRVLLSDGEQPQIRLADGDRIVVPPVGKVVGVSGWVQRPGIYELPPGQSTISIPRLVRLAGGLQVSGKFRFSLMKTDSQGRTNLVSLPSAKRGTARDGDILFVDRAADETVGRFEFYGPTSLAGEYSLDRYHTLASLLRTPGAMGRSPYMLLGLISRKDPKTLLRHLIAFSPQEILAGRTDITLKNADIVRIFDLAESGMLSQAVGIFTNKVDYLDAATAQGGGAASLTGNGSNATSRAGNGSNAPTSPFPSVAGGQAANSTDAASAASAAQTAAVKAALAAGLNSQLPNLQQSATQAPSQTTPNAGTKSSQSNSQVLAGSGTVQTPSNVATASQLQQQQLLDQMQAQSQFQQQAEEARDTTLRELSSGPFVLDQQNSSQGSVSITSEATNVATLGSQIGIDPTVLISALADHRVNLLGAVRAPGIFLVGGSNTLGELVASAGGTQNWANLSGVDLTRTVVDQKTGKFRTKRVSLDLTHESMNSITVMPRDIFRFDPIDTDVDQGVVAVQGQVHAPGTYDLVRGQRLSDLLKEAGGLTSDAYPYGAVFLRKSVARTQQIGMERSADDIQKQLVNAVAQGAVYGQGQGSVLSSASNFLQGIVAQLRSAKALGRLTIIADPARLATDPGADILLQPGDFLYVPSRPSSVSVVGEVLNPGSYTMRPSFDVSDYIHMAGGDNDYANGDDTFVIYPDGTTRKADNGWLGITSTGVPPGSVIVVPRDLTPVSYGYLITTITTVFRELAVSAASLAVISRNN